MISTKNGGGNKPQLYDTKNGEYTDEEKAKLFEIEMSNIVMKYIFGLNDTFEPRFPIYGFHNSDYCELYVKYCIKNPYIYIKDSKIEDYLLVFKEKNDKSYLFKSLGYEKKDYIILKENIINGLDKKHIKFNRFTEYGLKIEILSNVKSLNGNNAILVKTIWQYNEKNNSISFITTFPSNNKEK